MRPYTAPTIRSGSSTYSGSAQNLYGTAGSATGGTMYFSYRYHTIGTSTFGDWSGWSTSAPTGTNAGVYDVRYKVEPNAGYSGGVDATEIGSFTINKANGWCSLNPNSGRDFGTLKSGDYRVIVTHHGGSLSCSKSGNNSSNVTASVSSSTQVRIYKENSFNDGSGVTVTVTSAATTNYNAASAQFTCNQ